MCETWVTESIKDDWQNEDGKATGLMIGDRIYDRWLKKYMIGE